MLLGVVVIGGRVDGRVEEGDISALKSVRGGADWGSTPRNQSD